MNFAPDFALNEIEATAKKAARGAGYSWGMAEEAAKATRWLCANGFDGTGALAAVLTMADGTDLESMAPDVSCGEWIAKAGTMCPLSSGAALADFSGVGTASGVTLKNVIAPMMLLPFAAMAARQIGKLITVEWNEIAAATDGRRVSLKDNPNHETAAQVTISIAGKIAKPRPRQTRAFPNESDWATLNRFAHRTYAPATEESRLLGAGAGLSDND